jgi:hypothetical protein
MVNFGGGGTGWWWWCGGTDMAVGFLEGEIDEVNDGWDFMKLSCAKGVVAHARYRSISMMFVVGKF